ncbi:hypothetical protein SAMN02745781_02971 [Vibrio gazogenes DSM 21264]|uniref:Uncharacterized protein n=1 Tax=Vibrio gazogenes DSM 21264 = NBRC 103151 TaxID=1123492 RepID=A0A1M5DU20_VIBGA|nr:hypothetical protein SAMN02745781_02971 [Vibrio gazogenes DSM 21264] [Vibrio gazogenes DSM 21264 = NBRC 103151]
MPFAQERVAFLSLERERYFAAFFLMKRTHNVANKLLLAF